jgi:hypothetical protein
MSYCLDLHFAFHVEYMSSSTSLFFLTVLGSNSASCLLGRHCTSLTPQWVPFRLTRSVNWLFLWSLIIISVLTFSYFSLYCHYLFSLSVCLCLSADLQSVRIWNYPFLILPLLRRMLENIWCSLYMFGWMNEWVKIIFPWRTRYFS